MMLMMHFQVPEEDQILTVSYANLAWKTSIQKSMCSNRYRMKFGMISFETLETDRTDRDWMDSWIFVPQLFRMTLGATRMRRWQ